MLKLPVLFWFRTTKQQIFSFILISSLWPNHIFLFLYSENVCSSNMKCKYMQTSIIWIREVRENMWKKIDNRRYYSTIEFFASNVRVLHSILLTFVDEFFYLLIFFHTNDWLYHLNLYPLWFKWWAHEHTICLWLYNVILW